MKQVFNRPPFIDDDDGGGATLAEDLVFQVTAGVARLIIRVPKGFHTNFASTPRPIWGILPPRGRWSRAAALHDYLYSQPGDITRRFADSLFCEAMIQCGVWEWQAVAMWAAVRVFGGRFWKK
jgi:hypothetical protein